MSVATFIGVRRPAFLLIATLSFAYLLAAASQNISMASPRAQPILAQRISAGDVPDGVVHSIASALGGVEGVQELVVLPASSATGSYTVSATVEVPDTVQGQAAQWMTKNTSDFLQGVYNSGQPVDDAQIYYMSNDRIVGGAGVGRNVYHQLSAAVSTSDTGIAQALEDLPTVTADGPAESWFEVSVPGVVD